MNVRTTPSNQTISMRERMAMYNDNAGVLELHL